MVRVEHNKLIRDRIPEVIERDGKMFATVKMSEQDFRAALLLKLSEEAEEIVLAAQRSPEQLELELADLLEVIDAITAEFKIDEDRVLRLKESRYNERGGFTKRLKLLWVQH
jgi:predicted house-cleaning noncanonical NTP pyrophosphatase (MazG superfamily)